MTKVEIFSKINSLEPEIIQTLADLIALPSVTPFNGGDGEMAKAVYLQDRAFKLGLGTGERYDAVDPDGNIRPNLVFSVPGKTKRRLWIVTHMDVVPEGDRSLWKTDPFKAVIEDGKVIGRGSSDNLQELVSSLYALVALRQLNIEPEYEICLAFVADEEMGNRYGIVHLIKQKLFRSDDLLYVPDMGSESGDLVEVAEKSGLWVEFTVRGKQVHASMPQLGLNACRIANELSVALDHALHAAFPEADDLFAPNISTFEPTRREKNVPNINTVPGSETFCFDCRVLPSVDLKDVEAVIKEESDKISAKTGAEISWSFPNYNPAAEPTPVDCDAYQLISAAVSEVLNVKVRAIGIGGGTCAAFFRKEGIPAIVWGQEQDVAHMPNEYAKIEYILNETKVFALMMAGYKPV